MKKKLLVVLGAGSSFSPGMPSVKELNCHMKCWSDEWFRSDHTIPPDMDNYFRKLWAQEEIYYAKPFFTYHDEPNFEKVLGDMMSLAHWMAPPPLGNPLRGIVCGNRVPDGLDYLFEQDQERFDHNVNINWQFGYLLMRLAQFVRDRCRRFDARQEVFARYRRLIDSLCNTFDVGIYNLNYDNLAITAWPEAFTGFDESGGFDPCGVHERSEWGFVYHLHGSIHHTLKGHSIAPIHWQKNLGAKFKDIRGDQGQPDTKTADGKSFPLSTLIAGGFKLDQLLIEPFHSFYAAFARHAYQADAILIGGYGFGDVHVNRILQNCLEYRFGKDGAGMPRTMVLTKSNNGESQMNNRQDKWAIDLKQTLLCPDGFRCAFPDISGLNGRIPSHSFEDSAIEKVRIWHGGFCEVVDHLDKITVFLDGADLYNL